MKRLGPFHTLAAGVVLAVGLGVASAATAPGRDDTATTVDIKRAAKATTSVTPAPTPTAGVATATGDPSPPAVATPQRADYAGVVQRNGGLIALSIKKGKMVAYFCDGKNENWLKGTAENGIAALSGKNSLITAAIIDGKIQGRIQVGKTGWRFTAPLVKKPSGLYRATATVRGAKIVGGWIVLPDGRQVGVVKVGDSSAKAPAITPGSPVTVDGTSLRPEDADAFIDTF